MERTDQQNTKPKAVHPRCEAGQKTPALASAWKTMTFTTGPTTLAPVVWAFTAPQDSGEPHLPGLDSGMTLGKWRREGLRGLWRKARVSRPRLVPVSPRAGQAGQRPVHVAPICPCPPHPCIHAGHASPTSVCLLFPCSTDPGGAQVSAHA